MDVADVSESDAVAVLADVYKRQGPQKDGVKMIYLQLYLSFLQVGLFSVGGGYAAMPLIRSQVVELHPWMTLQEFTNLITIAERCV